MGLFTALLSGLLFGFGLIISGMANPAKIHGFLDITGQWDPSLSLVLMSAVFVTFFGVRIALKRAENNPNFTCSLPTNKEITPRLVAGSALFGVGWGLSGICPGPGLVALGLDYWPALLIVPAMLVGLWVGGRQIGE